MTDENPDRSLVINTDAPPFCPEGWTVVEHKGLGEWGWSLQRVSLYTASRQGGGWDNGHRLYEKLKDKTVLNVTVLDFLLENQRLISENWKDKYIFFWGTLYRDATQRLCIRFLYWDHDKWKWYHRWLVIGWNDDDPAILWRG